MSMDSKFNRGQFNINLPSIDQINVDLTPIKFIPSLECWASTHKACMYV